MALQLVPERCDTLPGEILDLCALSRGLIVGSYALYLLGVTDQRPDDLDMLIPPGQWPEAARRIPKGGTLNRWNGLRVPMRFSGFTLDVWAGDLGDYFGELLPHHPRVAVQPIERLVIVADRKGHA